MIRQGAILTESASDVLDVLSPGDIAPPQITPQSISDDATHSGLRSDAIGDKETCEIQQWLNKRLSPTPVEIDDLAREFQAPAAVLSEALMELELAGRIERHPGNMISTLIGT